MQTSLLAKMLNFSLINNYTAMKINAEFMAGKGCHKFSIWPGDKFFLQVTSAYRGCCAGLINNNSDHLVDDEIATLLTKVGNNVVT